MLHDRVGCCLRERGGGLQLRDMLMSPRASASPPGASPRAREAKSERPCRARGPARWLAPLLLVACSERQPDATSEFVDLYLHPGIEVCGGQLASYDRFIDQMFGRWTGSGAPADFRCAVSAQVDGHCGDLSCASLKMNHAWLQSDFGQYHELGHLVNYWLDGHSILSLSEGAAQSVGTNGLSSRASRLADSTPGFLWQPKIDAVDYSLAGEFVRYLIDHHGIDAFRGFYRAMVHAPDDEVSLRTEFEHAFDLGLDQDWADFIANDQCTYQDWFCDADDAYERVTLPYERRGIDCSDDRVLGFDATAIDPRDDRFERNIVLQFTLDEPARVTIALEHAMGYFSRCGSCEEQVTAPYPLLTSEDDLSAPFPIPMDLVAGDYALIVRTRPGGVPSVSITR